MSQDNASLDLASGPVDLSNARRDADARGLEMYEPKDREFLVDLDDTESQYVMEALIPLARRVGIDVRLTKITRSQHGNKHAYLEVPFPLTALERLLLQAVFGSDRKRELLAFARYRKGIEPTSVLFEVPKKKGKK